jgi:predicted CxxxxCH...CXXCH cytochrome family protein
MPGGGVIGGTHGDGSVEIVFDAKVVGPEASYAAATKTCAVSCHDQGGPRARPAWTETTPMGCGGCHGAPPASHPPGPCSTCHVEANADGTALTGGPLHMNGRVDLGDGSGGCGACHGHDGEAWPRTGAHDAHRAPALTTPIGCASCHPVPATPESPGHLDGRVQVVFSGRAIDRGARPTWDGATCASVACHGAGLVDPPAVVPAWSDTTVAASACGACHGAPPTQHTASTSCDRASCHSAEVERRADGTLAIRDAGKALHIDGVIESGL